MPTFPVGDFDEDMIDLGKDVSQTQDPLKPGAKPAVVSVKQYPSLYITDIDELDDLPDGEFYFLAKAKVTRHTEEEPIVGTIDSDGTDDSRSCSCEISVISMKPVGEAKKGVVNPEEDAETRLDKAFTKIEKKKKDADYDE